MKFLEELIPSPRWRPVPARGMIAIIEKQIRENEAAECRRRVDALDRLTGSKIPETTIDGAEARHFCRVHNLRPPEPVSHITTYRVSPTTEICALWRSRPGLFYLVRAIELHRTSLNVKPFLKPLI